MLIRRRGRGAAARPAGDGHRSHSLITLDQEPIRRSASEECLRAFESVERLKTRIRRHEELDLPAYARWLRREFAGLSARIRQAAETVADLEQLVDSVGRVADFVGCDLGTAYRIVMSERNADENELRRRKRRGSDDHPGGAAGSDEDGASFEEDRDDGAFEADHSGGERRSFDEEELRTAFEELFGAAGRGHGEKEEAFQEFRRFFAGERPERGSTPSEHDQRIKERYRRLARILHPDMGSAAGEGDFGATRRKELWLQVQAAYEARDLARLDQLLLLATISEKGAFFAATISEILALSARLRDALRPLRRQVRELRRSLAWEFADRKDLTDVRKRCERELRDELETFEGRRRFLERKINQWSRSSRNHGGDGAGESRMRTRHRGSRRGRVNR